MFVIESCPYPLSKQGMDLWLLHSRLHRALLDAISAHKRYQRKPTKRNRRAAHAADYLVSTVKEQLELEEQYG